MVKNKILRASALVAASAGLMLNMGVAVAGASPSAGMISTTGFNSSNKVINTDSLKAQAALSVANHVNTLVGNSSSQSAFSGPARASENTTGGEVMSGDNANRNVTSTMLSVHNTTPSFVMPSMPMLDSSSGNGQIGLTGADSSNTVVEKKTVDLSNKVNIANSVNTAVLNSSSQHAASGAATADRNTMVGDVVSGNSSNIDSTSTTIDVSN